GGLAVVDGRLRVAVDGHGRPLVVDGLVHLELDAPVVAYEGRHLERDADVLVGDRGRLGERRARDRGGGKGLRGRARDDRQLVRDGDHRLLVVRRDDRALLQDLRAGDVAEGREGGEHVDRVDVVRHRRRRRGRRGEPVADAEPREGGGKVGDGGAAVRGLPDVGRGRVQPRLGLVV